MRLKELSLLLLLLMPAQGVEVMIFIKNYDGEANLRIVDETGNLTERTVRSGELISLAEGNYTFELNALNKTIIKKLTLKDYGTLEFNLGFTNSTENLNVMLHTIVAQNGSIDEVIVVANSGDLNFEGDLVIPMPTFKNLKIRSTNLDFLYFEITDNSIVFKSILVPENGSGSIRINYDLLSDEINRDLINERVMIVSFAEILEYKNLSYKVREFNGNTIPILEGNGSYYIKFKFAEYSESPLALIAIALISASLFLLLFERRGRWKG